MPELDPDDSLTGLWACERDMKWDNAAYERKCVCVFTLSPTYLHNLESVICENSMCAQSYKAVAFSRLKSGELDK